MRNTSVFRVIFASLVFVFAVSLFTNTDALFKRKNGSLALVTVELEDISKSHIAGTNYGDFHVTHPVQGLGFDQKYSVDCLPTGETEASSVWYDFRRIHAEDDPVVSLQLELNTIYTCRGMIRTDEVLGTKLYTHHGDEFQTMICHDDPIETGAAVFLENKTRCLTGAKTTAPDSKPRIAFRAGYVGQHADNGLWKTDPDGNILSSSNFNAYAEKLAYCQKFWPGTNKALDPSYFSSTTGWYNAIPVPPTVTQTLTNWYGDKNLRRPSSYQVQTYECESPWYHWEWNNYGACQCNGTKVRTVRCVSNINSVVSDGYCNASSKPGTTTSCTAPTTGC